MPLQWFGNAAKRFIDGQIDKQMLAFGYRAEAIARHLAPMDTGRLKASIGMTYRQSDHTVQLHADERYAFFQEYGTRLMAPQPYLRPAIIAAGRIWGRVEMQFQQIVTPGTLPMPIARPKAIARRDRINPIHDRHKNIWKKTTVVFHGRAARSLSGYKPAIHSRQRF